MLTNADHPVAWAMLMYELSDAHEHLGDLIKKMNREGQIDEDSYRIHLGHVFAHLNRAWHGRDDERLDTVSDDASRERSQYPIDLLPMG